MMNPRITAASSIENFQIHLTFSNGEQGVFDAKPYLQYPAFIALNDADYFAKLKPSHGTIEWPNGVDFDPDTLFLESNKLKTH